MKTSIRLAALLTASALCSSSAFSASLPLSGFSTRGPPAASDIIPIQVSGSASVQKVTAAVLAAYVQNSAANYGAVCDGATDDTVAIQSAITASAASGAWPIRLPGMCKITTLYVNRVAGATTGELRFEPSPGINGPAGFVSSTATPMFDSTLTGTNPVSIGLGFYNLQFYSTNFSLATYVLSPKFGIVTFFDDYFRGIKLVNSSGTLQTYRILGGSYALGWTGTFITALNVYDMSIDNVAFQSGGAGISVVGGVYGVRVTNDLFEGSTGPFFSTGGANGLSVTGNYSEGNTNPDYILSTTYGASGVQFSGNFMQQYATNLANASFWNVLAGTGAVVSSAGNYTNGRLFDDTGASVIDSGSTFGLALNKSGANIGLLPLYSFSLTTAAATTDNAGTIGITALSHCTLTPTNASAATNMATTYISAKTTGFITVTHTATAGMTYDISCTGK